MKIKINQYNFNVEPKEHQKYWEYINSGTWEIETFNAIDHFLNKGDSAIDIGAWAGPISFYLAQNSKEVYALEPDPIIYPDLVENCKLNPHLTVNPFQLAISNKTEKINLFARKKYGQSSSSLLHRSHDNIDSETVRACSLTDFVSQEKIEQVDFIKIDTEGGEFIFLKEWDSILKHLNYPTLLVSFHLNQLEENLFYKKFKSKTLAKIILKSSRRLSLPILKKKISKEFREINLIIKAYKNSYDLSGEKVNFEKMIQLPKQIGNNSFIFSNKAWKQS